ncbi:Bbp19 family protein [Acinetobacter bereziniae]|uniref:Bbp19 family protein n=1 Tax=Acinetobacter bereziniae TaxID=106648 RepID=UPI0019003955|nr:hypothetical protein [Acinetobacter bereziniae]MBJ8474359.1 hypothetical protein [Acinetobacter bereziniae]
MIYVVITIAIVFLIYAVFQKIKHEEWQEKYWAENRLHQDTKLQLDLEIAELNKCKSFNKAHVLERDNALSDLQHAKFRIEQLENSLTKNDDETKESGVYFRQRELTRPTPETYRVVFDLDINGQRILEHLTQMYCRDAFSSTDRETNYKLGQQSVVHYMINQINKANDPNYSEVADNG